MFEIDSTDVSLYLVTNISWSCWMFCLLMGIHTTGCLKKFAITLGTQNPFSEYIYLMCRVFARIYLVIFWFWWCRVSILKLKKPVKHVLSEVMERKIVDLYRVSQKMYTKLIKCKLNLITLINNM